MASLSIQADNLFKKAQKLLITFPFIDIAGKYFKKVCLVGSAATNLMTDADIDIDCQVDKLDKDDISNFVNELLSYKQCRKVIVYNQLFDENPYAIVNIERFNFEDEKWILTFFISSNLNDTPRLVGEVKSKLNADKRKVILDLKEYRQNNQQKRSIPSHLIYEAVLDSGVKSVDGFKQFLTKKELTLVKKTK